MPTVMDAKLSKLLNEVFPKFEQSLDLIVNALNTDDEKRVWFANAYAENDTTAPKCKCLQFYHDWFTEIYYACHISKQDLKRFEFGHGCGRPTAGFWTLTSINGNGATQELIKAHKFCDMKRLKDELKLDVPLLANDILFIDGHKYFNYRSSAALQGLDFLLDGVPLEKWGESLLSKIQSLKT